MAPADGGLETGGMAWDRNRKLQLKIVSSVKAKIVKYAESWLKKKKGREKGDKYFLEGYLEDPKILIDDDKCLVKAKCYRSNLLIFCGQNGEENDLLLLQIGIS